MLPTTIEKAASDDRPDLRDVSSQISNNSFWKSNSIYKRSQEPSTRFVNQQINGHKPLTFIDPAFEPLHRSNSNIAAKYRIGEGNDITPNPAKLMTLGRKIQQVKSELRKPISGDKHPDMSRTKKMLISR